MSQVMMQSPTEMLAERLARGAELLFDMEQRGDTDGRYSQWLSGWLELLQEYEQLERMD